MKSLIPPTHGAIFTDESTEGSKLKSEFLKLFKDSSPIVDPVQSDTKLEAKNVHFTTGGPWFKAWGPKRDQDTKYAVEWCNDAKWLQMNGLIDESKDYVI